MRATLLVLTGCCLLAAPHPALGAATPKKATPKASKAAKAAPPVPEVPVLGPEAAKRVAVIDPALPKGMKKASLKKLTGVLEAELKALGLQVVPPAQVTALHLKRRLKAPACADTPECLAQAGKVAGAAYVANLFIASAGKAFNLKLMIVDSSDAALIANRASVVLKATDTIFLETIKRQVPRAGSALAARIAEKEAAVALAAAKNPDEPKPAEPKPGVAAEAEVEAEVEVGQPGPAAAAAAPEPAVASAEAARAMEAPLAAESAGTVAASSGGAGPVPWILLSAGVVAAGVGVSLFGTMASAAADDFKNGSDALAARDRAKQSALICDVAIGAGAVLAVVGISWLIYSAASGPSSPAPAVQAGLSVTPNGASLALSGSF